MVDLVSTGFAVPGAEVNYTASKNANVKGIRRVDFMRGPQEIGEVSKFCIRETDVSKNCGRRSSEQRTCFRKGHNSEGIPVTTRPQVAGGSLRRENQRSP